MTNLNSKVVDYTVISELAGDEVSQEQVDRSNRRYWWASDYCAGRDVLEVGCGVGQGVGYLARAAKSITAGDFSQQVLTYARRHYGTRFVFQQFDAQYLPFEDQSRDVILIFEALYYVPRPELFFKECKRVLRPEGVLLISSANKDLFDFSPSPNSFSYLGVVELNRALTALGFTCSFFGDTAVDQISLRQRIFRPIKAAVSKFGLMPKTNNSKKFLKRLIFGGLVTFPAEVLPPKVTWVKPIPIDEFVEDRLHKVILCAAKVNSV